MAGSAALVAECGKHDSNDPKCSELGWKCTPLAVETYGCWGAEARETLLQLATHLAMPMRCMHQVPGHCFHLWQTQPHFGEVLCKSSAVKSWTFIGCHWLTVLCCFLCASYFMYCILVFYFTVSLSLSLVIWIRPRAVSHPYYS